MSSFSTRAAVLTALSAVILAACGGPAATDPPTSPDEGLRSVEHARGVTEIPADPQRIVVLEPLQLDTAIGLGVTPVGTAVFSEATGVPAYLGDEASDVPSVGTVGDPSLESIAATDPDLILGTESRHAEIYDLLSGIAPTVFMAAHADPWQDNVRFVGDALGRTDAADELLSSYTDRCSEVAANHDTTGTTAQLVRPRDDVLSLYAPASFAGSVIECTGLTIPDRDWQDSISIDLSPELVLEARGDIVFVTAADPQAPNAVPSSMAIVGPDAFPSITVVDQASWISGVGPLGGLAVLDDIDRVLGS